MDTGDGEPAAAAVREGAVSMESYFPAFLYLTLGAWLLLLVLFGCFAVYLVRLPDDEIERYHAEAMKNKKRLGIKIYRF